jgi:hypothetical protein
MSKKTKVGIPIAVLTIIAGIAGGTYAFDFSTNTTSISGDTINNIANDLNINVDDLRALCAGDDIDEQYESACNVLRLIP